MAGNSATNVSGASGGPNTTGGDGGSGSSGQPAYGGAIYSQGPLYIYNSIVGTNSAFAGNGGAGGAGSAPGFGSAFGGIGGNGGSGGNAYGAAIYSTSGPNVFVYTEFFDNSCAAGSGAGGGASGGGAFPGPGGGGGTGGSAIGGAVFVSGSLFMTNCVFWGNTVTGGASGEDDSGNGGQSGGSAQAGGLYVASGTSEAILQNDEFFQNTCTGGAGGAGTGSLDGSSVSGGGGGSVEGGGLVSAASLMTLRYCTIANNSLNAGSGGAGSSSAASSGNATGFDIFGAGGAITIKGSLISGGGNGIPNTVGVTDAGYNVSSDSSMGRLYSTTIINTDPQLEGGLENNGGPAIGPTNILDGPVFETVDVVPDSVAVGFEPGVPGLTFPATDAAGYLRSTPTTAGALEGNPLTLDTNIGVTVLSLSGDSTIGVGGTVTLSVSATATATNYSIVDTNTTGTNSLGTNAISTNTITTTDVSSTLGYQWQLGGVSIFDGSTYSGTATPNLEIKNAGGAQSGEYTVVVSPSMLETAATSAPVTVSVKVPLKITSEPASKKVPYGSEAKFTVKATGSQPLAYQWYQLAPDGGSNILSDDGVNISGATDATLLIESAVTNDTGILTNDAGSYFVIVSDKFHTNTSSRAALTLAPDKTKPSIKFVSPASGARATNFTVTGTATDNAQVAYVNYWITNAGAPPYTNVATLSTNNTTTKTWTVTNGFSPGLNYLEVQAVDESGLASPIETRKFFLLTASTLHLTNGARGTVKGTALVKGDTAPTNGAVLIVGDSYKLTATPDKGYLLRRWITNGEYAGNSATLTFVMQSNLTIIDTFVTNRFEEYGTFGTYNGLFSVTDEPSPDNSGMVKNLKLGQSGTFTGSLLLHGQTYALDGFFGGNGQASNYVKRTHAQGGPLVLQMTNAVDSAIITGSVSDEQSGWVATLEAEKSMGSSPSAEYTILLTPDSTSNAVPGDGYFLVTNHNGSVTLTGALADGTAISQSTPLSFLGNVPVFSDTIYGGKGLLQGWINLSNGTVFANSMTWVRPAAKPGIYAAGFTNLLDVSGAGWTNGLSAGISDTNAMLAIDDPSTGFTLPYIAAISDNAILQSPATTNYIPNSLKGTIAPKTGLMTITFGTGVGKSTIVGHGVLLQNGTNGGGYFVTKTSTGSILLTP